MSKVMRQSRSETPFCCSVYAAENSWRSELQILLCNIPESSRVCTRPPDQKNVDFTPLAVEGWLDLK